MQIFRHYLRAGDGRLSRKGKQKRKTKETVRKDVTVIPPGQGLLTGRGTSSSVARRPPRRALSPRMPRAINVPLNPPPPPQGPPLFGLLTPPATPHHSRIASRPLQLEGLIPFPPSPTPTPMKIDGDVSFHLDIITFTS